VECLRYFFHIKCGQVTVLDQDGVELADIGEAAEEAARRGREIAGLSTWSSLTINGYRYSKCRCRIRAGVASNRNFRGLEEAQHQLGYAGVVVCKNRCERSELADAVHYKVITPQR
jgi:hypothetical protein